jgi:hypothetical protein
VNPERPDLLGQTFVIAKDGAAVAETAERLGGEETRRRHGAEAAGFPVPECSPETLRGILNKDEAVLLGERCDPGVIGRQAEKIHGDDGTRRQLAVTCDILYALRQCLRTDIVGVLVDIDEDRRRADQADDLGRCKKRERGREDGIAGTDIRRHQRKLQCICPVTDSDRVTDARIVRQCLFEFLHFRPEYELPVLEHVIDAALDRRPQVFELALQVDELHAYPGRTVDSPVIP